MGGGVATPRRRAGRSRTRRHGAAAVRFAACGVASLGAMPRAAAAHASAHGQWAQSGARGVHTSAPSSIRACAQSPGWAPDAPCAGASARRRRANLGARLGHRGVDAEEPGDHPLDVAVDNARRPAMGDGDDSGRGIGADSGERAELALGLGKRARVLSDEPPGAGVEVARPRVVAEPGPGVQDRIEIRRGQRLDIRPAGDKAAEVRLDRRHLGLLEHESRSTTRGRGRRRPPGPPAREAGGGSPRTTPAPSVRAPGGLGAGANPSPRPSLSRMAARYHMRVTRRPTWPMMYRWRANREAQGRQPIGVLVRRALGPSFGRRGFSRAEILIRWPAIVGAGLARHACPERLTAPRRAGGGTLRVRVEGGFATELQHLETEVIERINSYFGYRAVARLALVQGPLPVTAASRAPPSAAARRGRGGLARAGAGGHRGRSAPRLTGRARPPRHRPDPDRRGERRRRALNRTPLGARWRLEVGGGDAYNPTRYGVWSFP